jgi:hypothetical protein
MKHIGAPLHSWLAILPGPWQASLPGLSYPSGKKMDPPEVTRGIRGHGGTGETPLPWRALEVAQPHLPLPPEAAQKLTINSM